MDKSRAVEIAKQVMAENVGSTVDTVLYKAITEALKEVDFKGVILSAERVANIQTCFCGMVKYLEEGSVSMEAALFYMICEYETAICVTQIKASVEANVLSEETAKKLIDTMPNNKSTVKEQKAINIFDGIKKVTKGIKGAFSNAKQEVTPSERSYGKLDTVHETVGKTIDVVHTTNNVIIDGTTTLGCGVVNVAAGLAKGGILATGVVAKEVNKLGKTVGHKANDGAYEVGKTIANATIKKERNMSLSQLDKF